MPLSDVGIRNAKPRPAAFKMADGHGLYVLVQPDGRRYWRFDYRYLGRRKTLALGVYPTVGVADARKRHQAARQILEDGKDPGTERKLDAAAARISDRNTFGVVADEWLEVKVKGEGKAARTYNKNRWLIGIAKESLDARPITTILPSDLLKVLRGLERKGHLESAARLRTVFGRVFRYAIVTDRAEKNPAEALSEAISAPVVRHHAAILDPKKVGALLRALDGYDGEPGTAAALKFAPYVFVRPGELRMAEWKEVDLAAATWRIPPEKMKMGLPHIVPLSRQAVAQLKEVAALSGTCRYVFPSLRYGDRPLSENTLNAALRRLGFTKDEMTTHGFRTVASTHLNESGQFQRDWIERQLAHVEGNKVRASYNAAEYLPHRKAMMQWWADHLDALKANTRTVQDEIDELLG